MWSPSFKEQFNEFKWSAEMLIIAFSPLWLRFAFLDNNKNSEDDSYIVIQLIIFRSFSVVLDYGRGFG